MKRLPGAKVSSPGYEQNRITERFSDENEFERDKNRDLNNSLSKSNADLRSKTLNFENDFAPTGTLLGQRMGEGLQSEISANIARFRSNKQSKSTKFLSEDPQQLSMKDVNSTSRFSLLAGAKLFDQPDKIKP